MCFNGSNSKKAIYEVGTKGMPGLIIKKRKFIIVQGWLWLENKITENQWKIAKIIYTPY